MFLLIIYIMKWGVLPIAILLIVPSLALAVCNITDDTVISADTTLFANETPCSVNELNADGIIRINSTDVDLTCQGFQLLGNGTGTGIYSDKSGTVIDSCDITGYSNDVHFSGNYSSLINSVLAGTIKLTGGHAWIWNNTLGGVSLYYGYDENNTIIDNTINGGITAASQDAGDAPWFKILNNTITMTTYKGVAISTPTPKKVSGAEISGNNITTTNSVISYCIKLFGKENTIR